MKIGYFDPSPFVNYIQFSIIDENDPASGVDCIIPYSENIADMVANVSRVISSEHIKKVFTNNEENLNTFYPLIKQELASNYAYNDFTMEVYK